MILLSVANTINTTAYERLPEFGTMLALGDRSRDVFVLILVECLLLGLVGSALGTVAGLMLAFVISWIGIPMPPPPNSNLEFIARIRLVPSVVISAFLVGFLATVVASVVSAAPAAAKPYSPLDEYLLQSSIQGDRFEIAGGRLAQANGTSAAIKALGARLVKDHTKSLSEAVKVARNLGIAVPKAPTPSQEWELGTLGGLPATSFDAAYATLEVQDHKQDIDDTKLEISDGVNAGVRRLARTDLPVLRKHLALSKQAAAGG